MSEQFLPPTPEQLFRITGIAAKAANMQQKLKPSQSANARYIFPHAIETAYDFDTDNPRGTEHRVRAQIKKRHPTHEAPYYTWSLRMTESLWRTDEIGGVVSRYSLVWNEASVLKALKKVHQAPMGEVPELADLYGSVIQDDVPTILAAEADIAQLTRGDCEQLAEDLADYCEQSTRLVVR